MPKDFDMTPQPLKRPPLKSLPGAAARELANFVKDLNDPNKTGAVVPPGVDPLAELRGKADAVPTPAASVPGEPYLPAMTQQRAPVEAPLSAEKMSAFQGDKFAFTGRLKAGKDFVASALGLKIEGFADPLYAVLKHFFNTTNKDVDGARAFLQRVGQWGRGFTSSAYPLTTDRAIFCEFMRHQQIKSLTGFGVDWSQFGFDPDLWVKALLSRVMDGRRVAVVNVRFPNERDTLKAAGWSMFHVMCSKATWAERLVAAGLSPDSPAVNDESEQLAVSIERYVLTQIATKQPGGKLRCVWNDHRPCPSPRLITLEEFKTLCQKSPQA